MEAWNKGVDLDKLHYYSSTRATKISFAMDKPRREVIEHMVNNCYLAM